MEAIKDTLASLMRGLELKMRAVGGTSPEDLLKKVLTKSELAHIKCNYFKKDVLGLRISSSAVYYKLNLKKAHLLDTLKKQGAKIKDITLRMGD